MSKPLRWSLAILILVAVLYWVEQDVGWKRVLLAWQGVSVAQLVVLTLVTLASYLLRAYRAHVYFGRPAGHPFSQYVRINFLHNALNNFLPMRLGEASFPLLMKRTFDYPLARSTAGLLWIRLMDLHWLLLLLSLMALAQFGVLSLVLVAAMLAGPYLLVWLLQRFRDRLPARLVEKLHDTDHYRPANWRQATVLYGLTMLVWTAKLLVLSIIMLAFVDIPGIQALLAVISADLSSVLPIHGLAGSGTYEAAMLVALAPFGLDHDAVLLAAVNVHIYLLVVTLLSVPLAMLIPPLRAAQHAN